MTNSTSLLLRNGKLLDLENGTLITGKEVLVEGDRITAVRDQSTLSPEGVTVIDLGGRTLMPGLIDCMCMC